MHQGFPQHVRLFLGRVLASLFIILCINALTPNIYTPMAFSQIPSLSSPNTPQLPNGVTRQGLLEITNVKLDGKEVLKIASPVVFNRNELGTQIPVEVRARQIEANLEQIVKSDYSSGPNLSEERSLPLDPDTIRVFSETLNNQPLLLVKDSGLVEPRVLLTVTGADAQYHGTTKEILAGRWQKLLEKELRQSLELRKPGALKLQIDRAGKIAIATVITTILLSLLIKVLQWREKDLQQYQASHYQESQAIAQLPSESEISVQPTDEHKLELLEMLQQQFSSQIAIQRRLQIVRMLRWLVFWTIGFLWVATIAATLYQFPQTRHLAIGVISTPISILLVWFITGLVKRLINMAIDLLVKNWEKNTLTLENSQRRSQRMATTISALKGLITVSVYGFGIIWVLQFLNVASVSLLAFGTLLALALSLGIQNVIKDLVNGILILMEDQYAVGDLIAVGSAFGIVENVNLRITQIRSPDGRLITLPNSLIAQVDNLTRTWSRSDFVVEVAYNTDVDLALSVVWQEATQLAKDPAWKTYILHVGEVFGVERISNTGIEIKIWIKTTPLKHFDAARELRRRLKIAFDRHGIQIAIPQQILRGSLHDAISDFVLNAPNDGDRYSNKPPAT
jgi:moderate conductance mechanosensitive channel